MAIHLENAPWLDTSIPSSGQGYVKTLRGRKEGSHGFLPNTYVINFLADFIAVLSQAGWQQNGQPTHSTLTQNRRSVDIPAYGDQQEMPSKRTLYCQDFVATTTEGTFAGTRKMFEISLYVDTSNGDVVKWTRFLFYNPRVEQPEQLICSAEGNLLYWVAMGSNQEQSARNAALAITNLYASDPIGAFEATYNGYHPPDPDDPFSQGTFEIIFKAIGGFEADDYVVSWGPGGLQGSFLAGGHYPYKSTAGVRASIGTQHGLLRVGWGQVHAEFNLPAFAINNPILEPRYGYAHEYYIMTATGEQFTLTHRLHYAVLPDFFKVHSGSSGGGQTAPPGGVVFGVEFSPDHGGYVGRVHFCAAEPGTYTARIYTMLGGVVGQKTDTVFSAGWHTFQLAPPAQVNRNVHYLAVVIAEEGADYTKIGGFPPVSKARRMTAHYGVRLQGASSLTSQSVWQMERQFGTDYFVDPEYTYLISPGPQALLNPVSVSENAAMEHPEETTLLTPMLFSTLAPESSNLSANSINLLVTSILDQNSFDAIGLMYLLCWNSNVGTGFNDQLFHTAYPPSEPVSAIQRFPTLAFVGTTENPMGVAAGGGLFQPAYVLCNGNPKFNAGVIIAGRLWNMGILTTFVGQSQAVTVDGAAVYIRGVGGTHISLDVGRWDLFGNLLFFEQVLD